MKNFDEIGNFLKNKTIYLRNKEETVPITLRVQITLNLKLSSSMASSQMVLEWSISNFQGNLIPYIFSSRVDSNGKIWVILLN